MATLVAWLFLWPTLVQAHAADQIARALVSRDYEAIGKRVSRIEQQLSGIQPLSAERIVALAMEGVEFQGASVVEFPSTSAPRGKEYCLVPKPGGKRSCFAAFHEDNVTISVGELVVELLDDSDPGKAPMEEVALEMERQGIPFLYIAAHRMVVTPSDLRRAQQLGTDVYPLAKSYHAYLQDQSTQGQ